MPISTNDRVFMSFVELGVRTDPKRTVARILKLPCNVRCKISMHILPNLASLLDVCTLRKEGVVYTTKQCRRT